MPGFAAFCVALEPSLAFFREQVDGIEERMWSGGSQRAVALTPSSREVRCEDDERLRHPFTKGVCTTEHPPDRLHARQPAAVGRERSRHVEQPPRARGVV